MPDITVPTRTGYTFLGYFSGKDGVNPQYYTAAGKSATAWNRKWGSTIYAKWKANSAEYTVTLDPQGGSGGTESVTPTSGDAMPDITLPTYTG
jgi:hypothetical protein